MYAHRRYDGSVRDPAPGYDATPPDRFPADDVLADLATADGEHAHARVQRVLARYAALRAWILGAEPAPAALTSHARESARAHVAAATLTAAPDHRWHEGTLLLRLLDAGAAEAPSLLAAAATEAAGSGDRAGADALRRASRDATLIRLAEALRRRRPGA